MAYLQTSGLWDDITSVAQKAYDYGKTGLKYGEQGKALIDQGVAAGKQVQGIFTGGAVNAPAVQPQPARTTPGGTVMLQASPFMAARQVPQASWFGGSMPLLLGAGLAATAAYLLLRKRRR